MAQKGFETPFYVHEISDCPLGRDHCCEHTDSSRSTVTIPMPDGTQTLPPHHPPPNGSGASHLPPGFYALVDIVGEGAAGDEAASPLGHVQAAIFQHDLALTDDHQRGPTQLHPFKDVVLCSLEMGRGAKPQVWAWGRERGECILTCLGSCLHCH